MKEVSSFLSGCFEEADLARPVSFNRCALAYWDGFACFTTALKRLSSSSLKN